MADARRLNSNEAFGLRCHAEGCVRKATHAIGEDGTVVCAQHLTFFNPFQPFGPPPHHNEQNDFEGDG